MGRVVTEKERLKLTSVPRVTSSVDLSSKFEACENTSSPSSEHLIKNLKPNKEK